jgi:hypothetical protein
MAAYHQQVSFVIVKVNIIMNVVFSTGLFYFGKPEKTGVSIDILSSPSHGGIPWSIANEIVMCEFMCELTRNGKEE